jgi:two-component system nitrate/nitrite response regulator NarL
VSLSLLIVDDSSVFLEAARGLLERDGLSVVGVASTSATAIDAAERLHPDVVLVDIVLGEESGIDLARRLVERFRGAVPAIVILISTEAEDDLAELIAASPASAFLAKSDLSAAAIRRLLPERPG